MAVMAAAGNGVPTSRNAIYGRVMEDRYGTWCGMACLRVECQG